MAKYLRYILKNLEPIRVADDAVSQSGQTDTLRYIPGSAVRGLVINAAAREMDLDQNPDIKNALFADKMVFTNAYPTTKAHTLIPSPKGFYEDKIVVEGIKELPVNVVINGASVEGKKRASLGRYCYMDKECIHYYSVETGSDLKIKINYAENEQQKVFRSEYIAAGQYFEGYIRLNDSCRDTATREQFKTGNTVILGNARSAGLGKCRIEKSDIIKEIPYAGKGFSAAKECYMMLLSNTAMRDANGESCGLNLAELEQKLGVTNLRIAYCSTSVKEVKGYNRTWKTKIPALMTYEAGSVFHFTFDGAITAARMEEVMDSGLGVRRNEGFGRVLFLKDYEKVHCKQAHETEKAEVEKTSRLSSDDRAALKVIARGYYKNLLDRAMEQYVTSHKLNTAGLKNSQLGTIQSILTEYRYTPSEAVDGLNRYMNHATDKEIGQKTQHERASILPIKKQLDDIMSADLEELLLSGEHSLKESGKVMGIPVAEFFKKEEADRYKIQLIINMMRYHTKNDKKEA